MGTYDMPKHKDDGTLARVAGNIAAGMIGIPSGDVYDEQTNDRIAAAAVAMAKRILAEIERMP